MAKRILSAYEKRIIADTGCSEEEVVFVEEVMRRDVLRSTLDWLTAEEFCAAAREAFAAYSYLKTVR